MGENDLLPEFLIQKLKAQYDDDIVEKIINGYSKERPITFRVNTLKSNREKIEASLDAVEIKYHHVPWYEDAFILENVGKNKIQELEIYKNGEIYLQSISSMIPPIMLDPKENTDILDMCAAPGGKTCQIACICKNNANITACELNKIRLERLKYNIEKQGIRGIYIVEKDARMLEDFFKFDQILLDAPCSGSGTIDLNNTKLKNVFTEKLINKSILSQKALLRKAITILKKGSTMVYSTCSILKEENENIINEELKRGQVEIIPINVKGLLTLKPRIEGTILIPPTELYEGFFVAKLKKVCD